jgi:hypothetical protein
VGIYWLLPMESPTERFRWWVRRWLCHVTIRRSRFESLGHSVGKIVWKKSTSSHHCNFSKKKNYIIRQWYGRYIPTEVETKLFLSVKITDKKSPLVIPSVFANFLVVILSGWSGLTND